MFIPGISEGVGFEDGLDKCFTLCVTSKNEGTNLVQYVPRCRTVISRGRVNLFVRSTKLDARRHFGHGAFLRLKKNRMLFSFAVS